MAKLSAHGTEIYRFYSVRLRALVSVRSDGVTLYRTPWAGWKVYSRIKKGTSYNEWHAAWNSLYAKLSPWKRQVKSLPTIAQIEEWSLDSVCETTEGDQCEPDHRGPGSPSWLVALGLV